MLTLEWIELLRGNGGGKYSVKKTKANQDAIHLYDAPFMTLMRGMWDYDLRIENMDKAGVDVAVVSLTCPNVFWGGRDISLKAARMSTTRWPSSSGRAPTAFAGSRHCLGNMPMTPRQ